MDQKNSFNDINDISVDPDNLVENIIVASLTDEVKENQGPYDISELNSSKSLLNTRLNLGSILIPTFETANVQFEVDTNGDLVNVYLVSENWKMSIGAYAAPKSQPQWRLVVTDLVESLKTDGAKVSIKSGRWGREVVAALHDTTVCFLGVDGPKWLLRGVIASRNLAVADLLAIGRSILAETIVNRDRLARPALEFLPMQFPKEFVNYLNGVDSTLDDEDLIDADETTYWFDKDNNQVDYRTNLSQSIYLRQIKKTDSLKSKSQENVE